MDFEGGYPPALIPRPFQRHAPGFMGIIMDLYTKKEIETPGCDRKTRSLQPEYRKSRSYPQSHLGKILSGVLN
jgi:hypothetical protein